ncbi:uncharacterized protein LOC133917636 [Phragmites australis]|uniref:uncharacterized protein LOC133917636 n=1 Tax=Phragmites australis TaxID=29695 RepID=UPI002D778B0E|nr:uncharacterized protein LOC133917636 [Phragmites australis]
MFSLSSPCLPLKGQLKLNTATTILLVAFIFTLYITFCEARHLRVHGNKHSSKLPLPSSPPKDVMEFCATKEKMRSSVVVRVGGNTDAVSMGKEVMVEVKKEVASSSGGVGNIKHDVRVLKQLPRREHEDDQGIHLDYAQPRTHTPCHNR